MSDAFEFWLNTLMGYESRSTRF